jgi:U3 small nucleolar RNA-associated protein 14
MSLSVTVYRRINFHFFHFPLVLLKSHVTPSHTQKHAHIHSPIAGRRKKKGEAALPPAALTSLCVFRFSDSYEMVRRSTAAKGERKGGRKSTKPLKRSDDDEMYQQPGKLMLNNPLIPAELDEDIDDDLAFNSEDERLYGEFFSDKAAAKPKLTKKKTKKTQRNDAHSDDEDDDFVEEGLAVVGKSEKKKTSKKGVAAKKGKRASRAAEEDDDEDEMTNYHEDGQSSGDDEDYIDLSDMLDQSLKEERKKKKTKAKVSSRVTETGTKVNKKRRAAQLTAEPESVYGLADSTRDGGAGSYSDAMRRIMHQKRSAVNDELEAVRGRIEQSLRNKHHLLTVDADDMTKDRLTRREVRTIVDEGMERYKPVLKELDSAKHIQFPMHLPDSTPVASSVGGIVAAADAQFRSDRAVPAAQANSSAYRLGTKMDALLSQAGLSRRNVSEAADTPNSIGNYVKFDDSESQQHFAAHDRDGDGEAPTAGYMAKLKAMLAYENSRRKRLNRIKSKTYRRILRKEKEREKERRQKAFELLHPELARQRLAERMLKARAEERVTQKHKNTSAWVKHAKRFAQFDENTKDAIDDQHAAHQRLMQKMEQDAGEDNYERYMAGDNDSEASSEEDRVVDALIAKVGASSGTPLSEKDVKSILWSSVDATDDEEGGAAAGGKASPIANARAELREMKFMKKAREREEKEYRDQIETLRRDIEAYQREENAGSEAEQDEVESQQQQAVPKTSAAGGSSGGSSNAPVSAGAGRIAFKAAGKKGQGTEQVQLRKQRGILLERAEEENAVTHSEEALSDDAEVSSLDSASVADDGDTTHTSAKGTKSAGKSVKHLSKAAKSASTAAGAAAAPATEFAGARPDARMGQYTKKTATSTRVTILPTKRARDSGNDATTVDTATVTASAAASEEGEAGVSEEDLQLHQEYLISRAFAQDDVDEDFIKEKEAQVETIMRPEDKNQSLPGWGEWGGEDPELNKRHQEAVQHNTVQRQIEKSFLLKSRADAALEHVIINHDGVELVPDRMTLHMVPRPFSNPQEFARSMRQPLGPEWTSALSFKEGVQPRVEVRQGQSVLPLDLSLRKQKPKTKRRKTEKAGAHPTAKV